VRVESLGIGDRFGPPRRGRNMKARGTAPGAEAPLRSKPREGGTGVNPWPVVSPLQGWAWGGRRGPGALPPG
jgi:hypothetical protein